MLIPATPLMAVLAILIRATSSGPAVFRQQRVGQHGKLFTIYKLRTMSPGSSPVRVSATTDPRVTPLGARLRGWKLDELPQLWNVLVGDMSLVGPRPEVPEYVEHWPERQRETILSVRPGITDPIAVALRDEGNLLAAASDPELFYLEHLVPMKTTGYVDYINHRSLLGDSLILWETLLSVLRVRGH